ncbi:MAG: hypothetical protein HOV86_12175 [Thermoactinospora sp.]|nr:hypothetical protein [Thermoactinospora sp.]
MADEYWRNGQPQPPRHGPDCPECALALASIGVMEQEVAPPPRLREAVLSKARRVRPPARPEVVEAAVPYAAQLALMDELLTELSDDEWSAPVVKHGTVRSMVEHLAANDRPVAALMGVPDGPWPRLWRGQATTLLERFSRNAGPLLEVEVDLAGRSPARGSLRAAMVQRAFETWTHADDIRTALARPLAAPDPDHVRRIAGFGIPKLPRARQGPPRDVAVMISLLGPGGGTWTVSLSEVPGRRVPLALTLRADAVGFCRLMAGRVLPDDFPYEAEGRAALAHEVVVAASRLGCD